MGAFENCTALTGVTLPDSVEELSYFAFKGCTALEYVRLPDHGVKMNSAGIFEDCVSLTKVEPLESISFVFGVGYRAFHNCVKLTRMYISGMGVSESAFAGCCSLEEFIVSPHNTFLQAAGNVLYNSDKTELICAPAAAGAFVIPEGVKSLDSSAFSGCKNLTSVVIPKSLTKIGNGAFSGCTALERFDVPNDHPKFRGEGPVLMSKDGSTLVAAPTASGTFPVPDGITVIGGSAFYGNERLEHVILPQGLTTIGDGAFRNCTNLNTLRFRRHWIKLELRRSPAVPVCRKYISRKTSSALRKRPLKAVPA